MMIPPVKEGKIHDDRYADQAPRPLMSVSKCMLPVAAYALPFTMVTSPLSMSNSQ
jgi:hypothetical protein